MPLAPSLYISPPAKSTFTLNFRMYSRDGGVLKASDCWVGLKTMKSSVNLSILEMNFKIFLIVNKKESWCLLTFIFFIPLFMLFCLIFCKPIF